jgi:intraflagellar transport protein 74
LKNSLEIMNRDIQKYEDLDTLQEKADSTREYLIEMKDRFTARRSYLDNEAEKLSLKYERRKLELEQNETWQSLQKLEDKLCRHGEIIHSLKEFVSRKRRQTHEIVKNECINITEELNNLLISSQ